MAQFPYPTPKEFADMTPDEFDSFWDAFEKMGALKQAPFNGGWFVGQRDIRDLKSLKRAGWKPQPIELYSQPMAWYWRRPIRAGTKDRKGKLFISTQQAINELLMIESRESKTVTNFVVELMIDGRPHRGTLPAKGCHNAQHMADAIGATLLTGEQIAPS